MTVTETISLDVCVDCILWLANGDTDEDGDWSPEDILEEWDGWHLHAGGTCEYCEDSEEPCEGWFSSSPCDCCGSSLGGSRHHATALLFEE